MCAEAAVARSIWSENARKNMHCFEVVHFTFHVGHTFLTLALEGTAKDARDTNMVLQLDEMARHAESSA